MDNRIKITILCTDFIFCMRGSFVRGVQLWKHFFSLMTGGRIKIPQSAGHHRPASETSFKSADDGPTLNASLVALWFKGIQTSIAKKPYIFCDFRGCSGPPVAPLDPHMFCTFLATVTIKTIDGEHFKADKMDNSMTFTKYEIGSAVAQW